MKMAILPAAVLHAFNSSLWDPGITADSSDSSPDCHNVGCICLGISLARGTGHSRGSMTSHSANRTAFVGHCPTFRKESAHFLS